MYAPVRNPEALHLGGSHPRRLGIAPRMPMRVEFGGDAVAAATRPDD